MHQQLTAAIPLDLVLTCPHKQTDGCACRKPKPGMLQEAVRRLGIVPADSFLIGDRSSDLAAGRAMGCTTLFIDRQYREPLQVVPDFWTHSLQDAIQWILDVSKK